MKFFDVLKNQNFLTNALTLVLSVFTMNGAQIPDGTADQLIDAIFNENWTLIGVLVITNLANPIYHIWKNKPEDFWSFLKSANFWTNVVSLVLMLFILNGAQIPEGTSQEVVDTIFTKNWLAFGIIILTNIANPIYQIFKNKTDGGDPEKVEALLAS
jgi:hypothetical protein